jgi:hypothetical protein
MCRLTNRLNFLHTTYGVVRKEGHYMRWRKMNGAFNPSVTQVMSCLDRHLENPNREVSNEDLAEAMRHFVGGCHVELQDRVEKMDTKLGEVHEALFHPETGLVNIKAWLCKIAKTAAIIVGGILSGAAAIAAIGHNFGIW